MKLRPIGMIPTRWHVEQLAKEVSDVTEIDLSKAEVIGASAMHQFLLSFPGAEITGLEGWNKQQYEWVMAAVR